MSMAILWALQSELSRHEVRMVRDKLLNRSMCFVAGLVLGLLIAASLISGGVR